MSSSRFFVEGSSQYLTAGVAPVTSLPITIAAWAKVEDITDSHAIVWLGDTGATSRLLGLILHGDIAGDHLYSYMVGVHGSTFTPTITSYSANTWHHVCGVWQTNSQASYLDGGGKGTNSDAVATPGYNGFDIGRFGDASAGDYTDGNIALVAIWDIALNDAEVAVLAGGALPTEVQAGNLVAYWLDGTEVDTDHKGSYDLTPSGSPTWDSGDWPIAPAGGIVVLRRRRM